MVDEIVTKSREMMSTNKVHNVSFITWCQYFKEDIESLRDTGKEADRKKYSLPVRTFYNFVCLPVCCSPCFAWSTLWRFVACPLQCLCKGPGFCCSNNVCTDGTDKCISLTYQSVNTNDKLSLLVLDKETLSPEEKLLLTDTLVFLKNVMEKCTVRVYVIIDYVYPYLCQIRKYFKIEGEMESDKDSVINAIDDIVLSISKPK